MKTTLTDGELTRNFEMIGLNREMIIKWYEDTVISDDVIKAVEKMSDGGVESLAFNAVEGLYDTFVDNVMDEFEKHYLTLA